MIFIYDLFTIQIDKVQTALISQLFKGSQNLYISTWFICLNWGVKQKNSSKWSCVYVDTNTFKSKYKYSIDTNYFVKHVHGEGNKDGTY